MAHLGRTLSAKAANLSLIPGFYVVEGENFQKLSSDFHVFLCVCACTHIHTHTIQREHGRWASW